MKVSLVCITFSAFVLTAVYFAFSQTRPPLEPMENPHLIISKNKRLLEIYDGEKFVRRYKMAIGFSSKGEKQTEGDGKTPEGEFYIFTKNPESKFYLSLGLSYPNIEAAERGLSEKLFRRKNTPQS